MTIPGATLEVPADPTSVVTAHGEVSASCPQGQVVVGGGAKVEAPNLMAVDDSYPGPGATAWTAHASNDEVDAPHTLTVTVICIAAGGTS